jgi:Galactose oxidase, central domain
MAAWKLGALSVALVLSCAASAPSRPPNGFLLVTPAMSSARAAHTTTTLPDERVLVAGGFAANDLIVGVQVYDAGLRRFLPGAPMITTRHSHSATLLLNGKVLIAGGYGEGSKTLATAEIFDPVTNAFTSTGSLLAARAGHIAVLLEDGKVLIAGGLGPNWAFLSSAELYDPATGEFSRTGSMTVSRESHAATRLLDGRVLIAGGHRGRGAGITLYASAETYDPVARKFIPVSAMRIRRHKHDAVLIPGGQVLITGGSDERDDRGVYASSELFDPKANLFSIGPVMKLGRYKHAGTSLLLPSGLVLIAGGAQQAETYNPVERTFTLVPGEYRMAGQFSAVAPLKNGGALITGGYGLGGGPRSTAWLYEP